MIHNRLKLAVLIGFMLAFAAIPSYAQKENRVFVKQIEVVGNTVLSSKEINPNKSIPRVSLSISKLSHLFSKKLHLLG